MITRTVAVSIRIGFLILALALPVAPQPTVAPSPVSAAGAQGADVGGYNIFNSWEVGYRFHSVGGNEGKYRSDVNFGNGIRLLQGHLGVYSKDGKGRFLDELVLTTQGLGNDPYQHANLRVRKNSLFEYGFLWRSNAYFNPALAISHGQHFLDTTRRWQDHRLTLFPESFLKGILAYGRNRQEGPGLSTVNYFGSLGDEFPFSTDIRRGFDEYRAGGELDLRRFHLRVVRVWENFNEDTQGFLVSPTAGNNPVEPGVLTEFRKDEPYHGLSKGWRGSLFFEQGRWLTISGRATYTGSDRNFIVDETATGVRRTGPEFDRQTLVFGSGQRPVSTANATVGLFPSDRISLSNHSAYYNVRMEGDATIRDFNNRDLAFDQFSFQALGIRTIVNSTDVNYSALNWIGVYGGYHYSTRQIRSREFLASGNLEEVVTARQDNTLHSGTVGVRIQPIKPLTINFEGEVGRADHPFYPVSDKDYHVLGGRIQYKTPSLLLSAATRVNYNTNSVTLSTHTSRSRSYALDASWTPSTRFALDAGYNKMHLDTLSGIAYFAAFQLVEGERSIYISNIHSVSVGMRAGLTNWLDLYLGYNRVQDTGDGRANPFVSASGSGSAMPALIAAQTFPLSFGSPAARLTWKLRERLHWNAGYQHYDYTQKFSNQQDYRAHTAYVSLLWAF